MWTVYDQYPEVVTFLISSVCIGGLEFFRAVFNAIWFSINYGLVTCKFQWFLVVAEQIHTFWGVTHVFSPKFKEMTDAKPPENEKRIIDMIWALSVMRFGSAIICSGFLGFSTLIFFCYLIQCNNPAEKKKNKECLE